MSDYSREHILDAIAYHERKALEEFECSDHAAAGREMKEEAYWRQKLEELDAQPSKPREDPVVTLFEQLDLDEDGRVSSDEFHKGMTGKRKTQLRALLAEAGGSDWKAVMAKIGSAEWVNLDEFTSAVQDNHPARKNFLAEIQASKVLVEQGNSSAAQRLEAKIAKREADEAAAIKEQEAARQQYVGSYGYYYDGGGWLTASSRLTLKEDGTFTWRYSDCSSREDPGESVFQEGTWKATGDTITVSDELSTGIYSRGRTFTWRHDGTKASVDSHGKKGYHDETSVLTRDS